MLEDTEFQEFWAANYPDFGANQPLIMTHAFMEVAYKAWLAAYDIGVEDGKALIQDMIM